MVELLSRDMYSVAEAARLLRITRPEKLRNWLDGYTRRGKSYPPVIRPEPTGSDIVTWGEFVEAGYLREYRVKHKVPLQHLRPVIDRLRDELGVPYPLAHEKPYVGAGRKLLRKLQEEEGLDRDLYVVLDRPDGQLVLSPTAASFVEKVEFDTGGGPALRLRPDGKDSPVVIDPKVAFGSPAVRAVRTEVLFELFTAGDPLEMICRNYDLAPNVVEAAVRFEARRLASDEPEEAAS